MNGRLCEACKNVGRYNSGNCLDSVYLNQTKHVLRLCYAHSVELFKSGQMQFVNRYHRDLLSASNSLKPTLKNKLSILSFGRHSSYD
jgi:hypothetical protein